MNINRNNYEEFFIDYVDGNLSAEQVAELMLFIAANPDLKEELSLLEQSPVLEYSEQEQFVNKNKLKKSEHDNAIIYNAFIAEFEGVATKEDKKVIEELPIEIIEKERKLIALTKVSPDFSIIFPDKDKLKHKTKVISMFYYYAAAAACLLIMFGGYRMFNNVENNDNNLATRVVKSEKTKLNVKENNQTILVASNTKLIYKTNKKTFGKKAHSGLPVINDGFKNDANVAVNQTTIANVNSNSSEVKKEEKVELENNQLDLDKNLVLAQIPETNTGRKTSNLEAVTPTDYVYKNVTGEMPEKGKENRLMNFARFAAAGIEKVTGRQAKAQKTQKDCGTKYNFKIGDLEFERTIACK